jgi:hypothetical protein
LIDANSACCEFGWANFDEALFEGTTWFSRCVFNSEARFVGAVFDGWLVSFEGARFEQRAWHRWTAFNAYTEFRGTRFAINAEFSRSRFSESADFTELSVTGIGWFTHNVFSASADFRGSKFGAAQFIEVAFEGPVDFRGATFINGAGRQEVFCSRIPKIKAACRWPEGWIRPDLYQAGRIGTCGVTDLTLMTANAGKRDTWTQVEVSGGQRCSDRRLRLFPIASVSPTPLAVVLVSGAVDGFVAFRVDVVRENMCSLRRERAGLTGGVSG